MTPPGLRVRLSRIAGVTAKGVLVEPLYLPVVTGAFTIVEEADHFEYDTHRSGQYSVPAQGPPTARKLRDLPIDALTLDWEAPWLVEWRDPRDVMTELNAVLRARTPVLLVATLVWDTPDEWRAPVTLRRTERELRPGEADTRYWALSFREYRDNAIDRRGADPANDRLPARHVLTATDTLEGLSQVYYRTAAGWRFIARENGLGAWGSRTLIWRHPRFKVGDPIKIPPKPDMRGALAGFGAHRA